MRYEAQVTEKEKGCSLLKCFLCVLLRDLIWRREQNNTWKPSSNRLIGNRFNEVMAIGNFISSSGEQLFLVVLRFGIKKER